MLTLLNKTTSWLNTSKIFAGMIMIMLNIGSKYITLKLSKSQEVFLRNYVAREVLIFSICWMGTRDILIAFIMTGLFVITVDYLFHEDSPYCLVAEKTMKDLHKLIDTDDDGVLSQKEIDHALNVLKQAKLNNQL